MLKANSLREYLTIHLPGVAASPENLVIRVPKGRACASGRPGNAFEYRYTLLVVLLDYAGDIDVVTMAIMTWARRHQPELIFNPDRSLRDIDFEADILDNDRVDIAFTLPLTEVVLAGTDEQGKPVFTHQDEPDYRALYGSDDGTWTPETEGHLTAGAE
ncbi:P2 phage tail completion protein R (GpR) [Escherichia coli M056]|uniref:phage tail protein n=1 Tax=Escherichia coli TaxID=562 RepID=UPI000A1855F3|nr:phage tail protein [Escherichia coli]OSK22881.1 P2 phage tail completion protein R (GpR) [Escherichia coli M056]